MKLKCNYCKITETVSENNGAVAWTEDDDTPVLIKGAGDGKWYHAVGHGCFDEAIKQTP